MDPKEKCGSIPELIDRIVSFLDHPTRLACLRVSSTWNKAATPHATRSSAANLMWPFALQPKKVPDCKEIREAFMRNLGHIQVLFLFDMAEMDLYTGADKLTNLTSLHYMRSEQNSQEATHLLKIIQKNPNLRTIHFHTDPFEGSNYFDNMAEGSRFHYEPYDDQMIWMTRLATALQPLALTELTLEGWLELFIPDVKMMLDAVLKPTLKKLKMHIDLQGYGIHDQLRDMLSDDISSDAPAELEETTVLGLETLHLDMMAHGKPECADSSILFHPFVFPILRKSPNLKHLFVSALHQSHVPELKAILQETCPLIEGLELSPTRRGPDERVYTDLILACPRVKKIQTYYGNPWDLTIFVPKILQHQNVCLNLVELQLETKHHAESSKWMQLLFCSLPNMRIFKQPLHADELARLNICDLVHSRWVCTKLEQLDLAIGSISKQPEEGEEEGAGEAETLEQRTIKVRQVYEQFGALTHLTSLGLCYKILEESPVQFDMTFGTGLAEMEPCLPSLEHFDIERVEKIQIGRQELRWMTWIGLERDSIVIDRRYLKDNGIDDEDSEDYEPYEDYQPYEDDEVDEVDEQYDEVEYSDESDE